MPQAELTTMYFLVVGGFLLHPLLMWIYSPLMYYVKLKDDSSDKWMLISILTLLLASLVLWPVIYIATMSPDLSLLGWYIGIILNCGLLALSGFKTWRIRKLIEVFYLPLMFTTPLVGYNLGLSIG